MTPQQHAKAVRARLMNPSRAIVDLPPPKHEPAPSPLPAPTAAFVNGFDSITMPPNIIRDMISAAAEKHGVTRAEILGSCRRKNIVAARREVMYRAVEAGYSLGEIGRRIGRDHTSVLYGHRLFNAMLENGEVTL